MQKHIEHIKAAQALLEGTDKAILVILGDLPNLGLMASQAIKRINSSLAVAAGANVEVAKNTEGAATAKQLTHIAGKPIKLHGTTHNVDRYKPVPKEVQDMEEAIEDVVISIQLGMEPAQLLTTHSELVLRATCVKYGLDVTVEEPERITKPLLADLYNAVMEKDAVDKAVKKADDAATGQLPPVHDAMLANRKAADAALAGYTNQSTLQQQVTAKKEAYDAANVALAAAINAKDSLPEDATTGQKSNATKAIKAAEEQAKTAYEELAAAEATLESANKINNPEPQS